MSVSAWNVNRKLRPSPIKTPPLRLPGQSIEERINELRSEFHEYLILPFCFVVLAMFECLRWWTAAPPNPILLTIAASITIVYAWIKIVPLKTMIRNLKVGQDGERSVGQMLEPLRGNGYRVFHDIPGADFNIDHAIVGPAGIFTIETKTKTKPMDGSHKILYDGHAIRLEDGRSFQQPLLQARAQAHGLANFLNDGRTKTFTVRPVVVFPEWYVETIGPRNKNDVWVLNPKQLASWLDQEPRVLSTDAIDAASHALTQYCRRPITEGSEG
jgi:hypothetical protein